MMLVEVLFNVYFSGFIDIFHYWTNNRDLLYKPSYRRNNTQEISATIKSAVRPGKLAVSFSVVKTNKQLLTIENFTLVWMHILLSFKVHQFLLFFYFLCM